MLRFRLHTKFIVLLTSVSLVPLIVVAGVTLARYQQTLEDDASKLGHQLASTAAAEIRSFMVSQFGILENIAAIYHPDFPIEPDIAEDITEITLLRSENFMDISVVDAAGDEIARKNRLLVVTEDDLGNVSGGEAFAAVRERGVYVGPVYVRSGRPFFDLGRRIIDSQGNFAGAVFAQVDARIMPDVVGDISEIVDPPGRVYIVNERGTVIAHPDLSYVLAERDLSDLPPVRAIAENPDNHDMAAFGTYVNENGDRVLGSSHPMTIQLFDLRSSETPSINWYVIAEQPEASVYGEARRAAYFSLAVSLIAVLLAIAAAIFFAGRISRPIEALHRAALEFGKGNLGYRASVETRDEIGDLAQSFNTTAGELEKTVASLKSEEKVTAAERNKLSLILAGITNAVIAVDLEGNIILFNRSAEALTGRNVRDVMGKGVKDIINLREGERIVDQSEYCPVSDMHAEGPVFAKNNLRMQGKDGEEHFVNVVSGRIREGLNINLGCVITFQDITREYVMDRTKREFVSIAAHQLRTPLTGMSWTVEALLSEAKGTLNVAQKELVERGLDAIKRMVDLVNDLLDVSRIEEGRFGIKPEVQPLAPLLSRVLDNLKKQASKKSVNLESRISPDLPPVSIDVDKMEFVLNNIVDNAVKYTPAGGTVVVSTRAEKNAVVIEVRDTGIGIPAAEFDRVFTKFFRSRKALLYHTDGSGLGLYVAKNIVEQHGGSVAFQSVENQGTTFVISLPQTLR
ncbi:MAG TPA: ATP-binding protein [Candidatus Paceibacterota bacterium]